MRDLLILLVLVVFAAGAVASGNGASRALQSHEILVAQTAGEMQLRGNYLVPYYNGLIRLEKPPLTYWLASAAHRLFGSPSMVRVSELEARFPSLVCGSLLLLATFGVGRAAFDDSRVGIAAAAILATTWHYFEYTRSARPEIVYALFCTLSILGFVTAIRNCERWVASRLPALFGWAAIALALLAKGPQLPVFFLVGIALALRRRDPRISFSAALHPIIGIFLISLVVLYFVFLGTHAEGAASFWLGQVVQDQPVPIWLRPLRLYYPAAVLFGLLPWIPILGLARLRARVREHPSTRLLASCVLVAVACLSFSGKLRDHYVLPTIPLCAVLLGAAIVDLHRAAAAGELATGAERRLLFAQAILLGIALSVIVVFSLQVSPVSGRRMLPSALPWLLLSFVLGWVAVRSGPAHGPRAFSAYVAALIAAWTAVAYAGLDASPRWERAARFAEAVDRLLPPGEPVILESGEDAALVYYGGREVVRSRARDWLDGHPKATPTYFVCEGTCEGVEGDVISAQQARPEGERMILLRSSRADRIVRERYEDFVCGQAAREEALP